MKFAILIKTPFSISAYRFCAAALKAGHTFTAIFFYQDGVFNSNLFLPTPSDEFNSVAAWQELAVRHQLSLLVCSTAAHRRGLINAAEDIPNLAKHFQISGLGQWVTACEKADRVVVFGD